MEIQADEYGASFNILLRYRNRVFKKKTRFKLDSTPLSSKNAELRASVFNLAVTKIDNF